MDNNDLKWAIAQANDENWNPGIHDWVSILYARPCWSFYSD